MAKPQFPSLADQERFWETWQDEKSVTRWSLKRAETILEILRGLRLESPEILDLGCGNGWFTQRLAAFGRATGTDLSRKAMAEATARFPQATFLGGDLFEVALPEAHYDVVVSQQVVAHVVDQPRYVDRAASLLKPRGYLILTTPNKFVMARLGDLGWDHSVPEHIEQWLDRRALQRLLAPKFEVLHLTSILPMGKGGLLRIVNSHKLNRLLGLVIPPSRLEAFKEQAGLGYTLVALCRKRP